MMENTRTSTAKHIRVAIITIAAFTWLYFVMVSAPLAHASTLATTRYVAPTGNDGGSCSSAASPCRTIQRAVDQASSGDRILVAQGTYILVNNTCTFLGTAAVVCVLDKDLTILGGYLPTNWSSPNPSPSLTIIDGQSTYRGVAVIGYNTKTAHLDMEGFTIQNGRTIGPVFDGNSSGFGGGIWANAASVTLRNMVLKNNKAIGEDNPPGGIGGDGAGGGLMIAAAPAGSLVENVTFEGNQSLGGTGPTRGGVAFGALFVFQSALTVSDSTFLNNLSKAGSTSGGGTDGSLGQDALGGGIGAEQSALTLQRITVTGNQTIGGNAASAPGGSFGAGIFVENSPTLSLTDSYVGGNTATAGNASFGGLAAGGGICLQDAPATMARVRVIGNTAQGGNSTGRGSVGAAEGGGILMFATRAGIAASSLTNLIIADNKARTGTLGTSTSNGGGGGIQIVGLPVSMTHATVARNSLSSTLVAGEGLLVQNGYNIPSTVSANYSIFADHTTGGQGAPAVVVFQGNTLTFNRGLFAGNAKDTNASGGPVAPGTITGLGTMQTASSARFVSPGSPNYNYHLRADSAAKDQAVGSSTTDDIDRQSRPYNKVSDLGADEYSPFPLSIAPWNSSLQLDWTQGANLVAGAVNHFEILIACPAGARAPSEGTCGQPFGVGTVTNFRLTGLTNFKQYTLRVDARDASGILIATSITATGFPTDIFVALPLIMK